MPSLLRRMQPWLTSLPSDDGSPVPWMPTVPSPPPKDVYTSEWAEMPKAKGPYAERAELGAHLGHDPEGNGRRCRRWRRGAGAEAGALDLAAPGQRQGQRKGENACRSLEGPPGHERQGTDGTDVTDVVWTPTPG